MDKTVTASFGSVDMATCAAKAVRSHFDDVKGIKVSYQHIKNLDEGGIDFFAAVPPAVPMATVPISGEVFPEMAEAPAFSGREPDAEYNRTHRKVRVKITADEKSTGKIASALRTCGGWDVQVS